MSVRQDTAQLIISIDAKESVAYQKAVGESAALVNNIKKAEIGTKEYNDALAAQSRISKELAATDYTKLSLKNLKDRARQLKDLQNILPQTTFAERGLADELRNVNQAMRASVDSTRAVGRNLQELDTTSTGFFANFKKGVAFFSPLALYQGLRQVGGALFRLGKDSITAFDEAAKREAQLLAAIESTGGAANKTVEQLLAQSQELQKTTLYSDDQVQEAQGLLLTFTKVSDEVYDRAIPSILDMSTAMGTDLKGASIQVGKALNDPVKGVAALSKAGVQFTADQKAMIKELVASGDIVGAQTIILKELETQFNGSAKAAADAGLGPFQKFGNRIDDIKESVGQLLLQALTLFAPALNFVAAALEQAVVYAIAFAKGVAAIPEFIRENETALKLLVTGLVIFNGQMVFAAANSLRLAIVEKGRAIATASVTLAQNLLNAAMTANPIGILVKAIGLLVIGFGILYSKSETVRAGIAGLGNVAKEIFGILKESVGAFIDGFKKIGDRDFKGAFSSFSDALAKSNPVGIALTQGKRLKDAFNKGYNDKLAAEKAQKEAEKQAQDLINATNGLKPNGQKNPAAANPVLDDKAKEKAKEKEKEKEKAPDYEKLLKERLAAVKDAGDKELQILEKQFLEGKILQESYDAQKVEAKRATYNNQLALLTFLGQKDTEAYREIELNKLRLDKEVTDQRVKAKLEALDELATVELEANERQFIEGLITEEEKEQERLEIIKVQHENKLALLAELGLQETDVYKKLAQERTDAEADQHKKQLDNEKRHAEMKAAIQKEAGKTLSDSIDFAIELLGRDEAARKKNASFIKAFEVGKIVVNGIREVSEIWKNAAALGPVGIALGVINTAIAVGRTAVGISKVNAQKFGLGGDIRMGGVFRGPSHAQGGIRLGRDIEVEGDETIINAKSSRLFRRELNAINTFRGYGRRLFALGGSINPNTTPTGIQGVPLGGGGTSGGFGFDPSMLAAFTNALNYFTAMAPAILSNIRATVVYSELANAADTVADINNKSQF